MARHAQLRDVDDYARSDEPRGAEVYPFPRYRERAAGERRTVQIRGQTVPPPRRRSSSASRRVSSRPDRLALWAVLLGIVLIAMAAATAHAAVHAHHAAVHAAQLVR